MIWPRFGRYHVARLDTLGSLLRTRGAALVALETASDDDTYDWTPEPGAGAFDRETLFPGRSYDTIRAGEMARAVTAALDRLDPDAVAVASYSTPDARAALAWCRRHRRVAVMMFDSRQEDAERSRWREWVKRQLVGLFDAALVGGTPHIEYAVALGLPRSHVFTPVDVVDNGFFERGARDARRAGGPVPGLGAECPFFLTVSRLIAVKNLPVLLTAYERYRARVTSPWPLIVVGDGPERGALERAAGQGVAFAGDQPVDALPEFYGRAGAFVLSSRKDTWGLVVNEAMASGLPLVVSDGAGCAPDLVEEGQNGFVVPRDDADALAARLGTLSEARDDERAAMGRQSREIVARFGLDAFAEGMWAAVESGRSRSDRGLSAGGAIVLGLLRALSRAPSSFNAIPD